MSGSDDGGIGMWRYFFKYFFSAIANFVGHLISYTWRNQGDRNFQTLNCSDCLKSQGRSLYHDALWNEEY
ncbi:MAG: hypothetical protein KME09_06480 [Pleurocapsa minor HA4230-MV1]|nr:hypothetical protein [Pleurocapsa minor HA4230-MV1]